MRFVALAASALFLSSLAFAPASAMPVASHRRRRRWIPRSSSLPPIVAEDDGGGHARRAGGGGHRGGVHRGHVSRPGFHRGGRPGYRPGYRRGGRVVVRPGYRHGFYRPGFRYRTAPVGWRRYGARPWNWQARGCILVGPFWFCP